MRAAPALRSIRACEFLTPSAPNMVRLEAMEILHADDALLVLNKPSGLPVLPDGWDAEAPYLLALAQAEYGRLWVVHRLDKVTSGVLVFARSADAHRLLSLQFERHEAHKIYHGIVNGQPGWEEKTARQRLTANVGHKHRTLIDGRYGKPSTTTFAVVERLETHALLQAQPLTGRTHQVRAHASALAHPLLGDSLYGAPPTLLIERPALHALSLTLTHPETGLPTTFVAGYPADFERALVALRRR
jgi:RluA family pseudouridine synthase